MTGLEEFNENNNYYFVPGDQSIFKRPTQWTNRSRFCGKKEEKRKRTKVRQKGKNSSQSAKSRGEWHDRRPGHGQ